jgi:hypothetical protein
MDTRPGKALRSGPATRRLRSSWAAFGVTLALALTACGSHDSAQNTADDPAAEGTAPTASPTATTDPGVKPADGPVLKAQGFSFNAPQGWTDVTDRAATGVLLSAAHAADEQPIAITVRRVTPGPKSASAARARATALLKEAGATGIHAVADTTVGGNPAAHVLGVQRLRGTHYQLDVYYVRTPNAGWPLMFATDLYTTGDRRDAMLASVLETCHWQSA